MSCSSLSFFIPYFFLVVPSFLFFFTLPNFFSPSQSSFYFLSFPSFFFFPHPSSYASFFLLISYSLHQSFSSYSLIFPLSLPHHSSSIPHPNRPSSHHRLAGATTTTNTQYRRQDSTSPPPYQSMLSRKFSSISTISTSPSSVVEGIEDMEMKEKGPKLEGQLVKEEFTQTGRVGWRVYQFYATSIGHASLLLPLLFFFVGQVGVLPKLLSYATDSYPLCIDKIIAERSSYY